MRSQTKSGSHLKGDKGYQSRSWGHLRENYAGKYNNMIGKAPYVPTKKITKRSKKSIESNTGNKFTRLYVNFESFENMTEHDLIPRQTPVQYSEKLLKSVGNATIPVKKSLERAKMFK